MKYSFATLKAALTLSGFIVATALAETRSQPEKQATQGAQLQEKAKEVSSLNTKIDQLQDSLDTYDERLSSLSEQIAAAQKNLSRLPQQEAGQSDSFFQRYLQEDFTSLGRLQMEENSLNALKDQILAERRNIQEKLNFIAQLEIQGVSSDQLQQTRMSYKQDLEALGAHERQYQNKELQLNLEKLQSQRWRFWQMNEDQHWLLQQQASSLKQAQDQLKTLQGEFESLQKRRTQDAELLSSTQEEYLSRKQDLDELQAKTQL